MKKYHFKTSGTEPDEVCEEKCKEYECQMYTSSKMAYICKGCRRNYSELPDEFKPVSEEKNGKRK